MGTKKKTYSWNRNIKSLKQKWIKNKENKVWNKKRIIHETEMKKGMQQKRIKHGTNKNKEWNK